MKSVVNINTYARDTMGINNLGIIDTLMRAAVTLGMVLYLLMFVESMTAVHVGMAMASILLGATVACRWDPVYHLLGWSSDELRIAAWLRGAANEELETASGSGQAEVIAIDRRDTAANDDRADRKAA